MKVKWRFLDRNNQASQIITCSQKMNLSLTIPLRSALMKWVIVKRILNREMIIKTLMIKINIKNSLSYSHMTLSSQFREERLSKLKQQRLTKYWKNILWIKEASRFKLKYYEQFVIKKMDPKRSNSRIKEKT